MPKNDYLRRKQLERQRDIRDQGMIARMQTLDKVTIALGHMGMSPDFIADFEDEYCRIEDTFCHDVCEDGSIDRTLFYSRFEIDRSIENYVRKDRFHPYEERYNVNAEDRIRKIFFGIKEGDIKCMK